MKPIRFFIPLTAMIFAGAFLACEDEVSQIGSSISSGDVKINIDSTVYDLKAKSVVNRNYDSRSGSLLLGNLDIPEYGKLNCSFVTRLMCVQDLPQADTVGVERIDSCKFLLGIVKGNLTGDSLAPQQLSMYRLTQQLPNNITNEFNPSGYYSSSSLLGKQNYTVSTILMTDSASKKAESIFIEVPVDKKVAQDVFTAYKENPQIFLWPQSFAQYFPGVYVESSFGKGCVANISLMVFQAFWHTKVTKTTTVDGVNKTEIVNQPDSLYVFSTTPEVLSSNNISYTVSDNIKNRVNAGETIITTPGGYVADFTFPAREIIRDYNNDNSNLSIISSLSLSIPAESIENSYGIKPAPYMLMIKKSEVESFFKNNKIPDNSTSFYSAYDSSNKRYYFSALRNYILSLIEKGNVTDEDVDFTLIPVNVTGETVPGGYYGAPSSFYVTKCVPYTIAPSMTMLDTKKAQVVFTFSSQIVE